MHGCCVSQCDENKPCSNCARHGVKCTLVTWDEHAPDPVPIPTARSGSVASNSGRKTSDAAFSQKVGMLMIIWLVLSCLIDSTVLITNTHVPPNRARTQPITIYTRRRIQSRKPGSVSLPLQIRPQGRNRRTRYMAPRSRTHASLEHKSISDNVRPKTQRIHLANHGSATCHDAYIPNAWPPRLLGAASRVPATRTSTRLLDVVLTPPKPRYTSHDQSAFRHLSRKLPRIVCNIGADNTNVVCNDNLR